MLATSLVAALSHNGVVIAEVLVLCPRCSEPQLPGALRCTVCGARLHSPGATARRRRGSAGGVLFAWVGLGVVALFGLILLPGVIGGGLHRAVDEVEARVPRAGASDALPALSTPATSVVAAVAPSNPASPGGSSATRVVVTEQDLNERVAEHHQDIQPLDHVLIHISISGIVVDFSAYNLSGTYRGQVTVVDGVPLVTGGKISGVLGWFVTPADLEAALNQEIAAAVAEQGVRIEQVETEPGQLVFYVE